MKSNEEESDWFGHKHDNVHRDPVRKDKGNGALHNKRITAEKIQNYLKTTVWFTILVATVIYIFINFNYGKKIYNERRYLRS